MAFSLLFFFFFSFLLRKDTNLCTIPYSTSPDFPPFTYTLHTYLTYIPTYTCSKRESKSIPNQRVQRPISSREYLTVKSTIACERGRAAWHGLASRAGRLTAIVFLVPKWLGARNCQGHFLDFCSSTSSSSITRTNDKRKRSPCRRIPIPTAGEATSRPNTPPHESQNRPGRRAQGGRFDPFASESLAVTMGTECETCQLAAVPTGDFPSSAGWEMDGGGETVTRARVGFFAWRVWSREERARGSLDGCGLGVVSTATARRLVPGRGRGSGF